MASLLGASLSTLLLLAGLALVVLEGFAPGAHFIVLGVALLAAGLLGVLFPAVANPLVLGLTVLVAGAGSFYLYRHFEFYKGTDRGKTEGSAELAGAQGYVRERVTPRAGRVKIESGGFDPSYEARSVEGEIPVGAPVIVVDPGGGNVLTVEAIGEGDDIDRELERHAAEAAEKRMDREATEEEAGRS